MSTQSTKSNETPPGKSPAAAKPRIQYVEELQWELNKLVEELKKHSAEKGIFVRLVELGCQQIVPEIENGLKKFQERLRQAHLDAPRISEITVILKTELACRHGNDPGAAPSVAQRFIHGGLSVREALDEARSKSSKPRKPGSKTTRSAAKKLQQVRDNLEVAIARLMKFHMQGTVEWPVTCGLFQLRFTPAVTPQREQAS
jgi:hypothetical protein